MIPYLHDLDALLLAHAFAHICKAATVCLCSFLISFDIV